MNNDKFATIDGFEELAPLQVWQMAYDHVNKTGKKSVLPGDTCAYGGVGCAASVFLKEEYRDRFDSSPSGSWRSLHAFGYVPGTHLEFIVKIQKCHDESPNGTDEMFLRFFNESMLKIKPEESEPVKVVE